MLSDVVNRVISHFAPENVYVSTSKQWEIITLILKNCHYNPFISSSGLIAGPEIVNGQVL